MVAVSFDRKLESLQVFLFVDVTFIFSKLKMCGEKQTGSVSGKNTASLKITEVTERKKSKQSFFFSKTKTLTCSKAAKTVEVVTMHMSISHNNSLV